MVRPPTPITWLATCVHGIRNHDVADQHPFAAVEDDVLAHLGDGALMAHNAPADLAVLGREVPSWQPSAVIDTLKLARKVLPGLKRMRWVISRTPSGSTREFHPAGGAIVPLTMRWLPRPLFRLAAESGLTTVAQLAGLPAAAPEPTALF